MIKHIVLSRFRRDPDPDRVAALVAEYEGFAARYPAMKAFDVGWNRSLRDDRFEAGFVVEFETEAELRAYLDSASHEDHVTSRFRPLVEERAIVSFSYEPGTHEVEPRPLAL